MKPLLLWPWTDARSLARQLNTDVKSVLRELGWHKRHGRFTLLIPPSDASLQLPAGRYKSHTASHCLVPAEAAMPLATGRGRSVHRIDPSGDLAAAAAVLAAAPSTRPSTAVIAVLAHVDHGKTTLKTR